MAKMFLDRSERYRVRGIPYMALFREGKLAKQVIGYQPKAALEVSLGLVVRA